MFKDKTFTTLLPILLVNFIGTLGFSLVIPFLVIVVHNFGGNAVMYGLVASFYPLFQLVGGPLLGKWSDSWGRRPVLLLSQVGTLASWIIFLISLYLPVIPIFQTDNFLTGTAVVTLPLMVLALGRALDGLTGGNISVAQAYMADISGKEDRSKNFGQFQVASTLGFIIGPALAGILGSTFLAEKLPVIAAIFISTLASLYIAFYLPEPERRKSRTKQVVNFKKVFSIPKVGFLIALYFLIFVAFSLFYTSFPVYATQDLAWSVGKMGIYFAFLSMVMAVVQGPVLGRVSKQFAEKPLIIFGVLSLALNFVLISSGNEVLIYLAAVLFALGNGIGWPSLLALLSKAAGEDNQGIVHGTAMSGGSLASIIGLIGGGVLYSSLAEMTFLVSASLMVFAAVAMVSFRD